MAARCSSVTAMPLSAIPLDRPDRERAGHLAGGRPFHFRPGSMRIYAVLVPRTFSSRPTTRATYSPCEPYAPLPEPSDDTGDVIGPPGMPVPISPRLAYMPNFACLMTGEALAIVQAFVDNAFHGRAVVPAESGGLLAPDVSFVGLDLAKTPLGTGARQDVQLVVGRQAVLVEALVFGVGLRLVKDLLTPPCRTPC
jgi:hypothetical protein